jgi:hypothetical protein
VRRRSLPRTIIPALLALAACDPTITIPRGGEGSAKAGAFYVAGMTPAPGRIEVGPELVIEVTFSEALDPHSAEEEEAEFQSLAPAETVRSELVFDPARPQALRLKPLAPLSPGRQYRLHLPASLASASGLRLGSGAGGPEGLPLPIELETFQEPPVLGGGFAVEAAACSAAIRARWAPARDNDPAGVRYEIFTFPAGTPEPFDLSQPASRTPPGATEELVTGRLPHQDYLVVLRAVDAVGNPSEPSPALPVRTAGDDDDQPPRFAGVERIEALVSAPDRLRVGWTAAEDGCAPSADLRYRVYISLDPGVQDFSEPCLASPPARCLVSPPGATEIELAGLAPDTTYFVVVRAVDTAGNESDNREELEATTAVSFRANVLPLLTENTQGGCTRSTCHEPAFPRGGLNLATYDDLLRGGNSQRLGLPIIVPGEPFGNAMRSFILWRTDQRNLNFRGPRMPLSRPALSAAQLDMLKRWIHQGAVNN